LKEWIVVESLEFRQLFKELTALTPADYIRRLKLAKADFGYGMKPAGHRRFLRIGIGRVGEGDRILDVLSGSWL
jgi:hypothetical protein